MNILKKIKRSTLIEILIAVLLPVFYFFLIGGFNAKIVPVDTSNVPYDPLSVIKTDFVKAIKSGNAEVFKNISNDSGNMPLNDKLSKLVKAQRFVFDSHKSPDTTARGFYFSEVNGYNERDSSGADVLYLSSGSYVDNRTKMEKCYIAGNIKGNMPLEFDLDTTSAREWYLRPRLKIRRADFSPGDVRPVMAVVVSGSNGRVVDSTVIKVRNFSDLNGKYEGKFTDKFMTELDMPGNYMRITSEKLQNTGSGFDLRIFWFGEVDVWFDKVTMMDQMANLLFEGNYYQLIISEGGKGDLYKIGQLVKNDKFRFQNYTAVNYVMNVLYDNLHNKAKLP